MRFVQYSKLRFPLTKVPRLTTSFAYSSGVPTPFLTSYHHYHHCNSILSIACSNKIGFSANRQLRLNRCYSKSTDETEAEMQPKHDTNQLIAMQKKRAMEYWECSMKETNSDITDTTYSKVFEQLKKGKVPPYYHTLCRKVEERLFLPDTKFQYKKMMQKEQAMALWESWYTKGNLGSISPDVYVDGLNNLQQKVVPPIFHDLYDVSDKEEICDDTSTAEEMITVKVPISIHLSIEAVQVGTAELKKNGEIPSLQDDSYLQGFFCDDIKNARVNVEDNRLSKNWTFNEYYTQLVTDLVNTPAKMVGSDIEVTQLESAFELDIKSGANLITRSLSRGVVADCFRLSKVGDDHAIVGNPGIGKSWTLVYALQQALLYENACVLFCFQKQSTAMVCIRRDNHIYVWRNDDPSFGGQFNSRLVENRNVLVLLDPRESKEGGASFIAGARRLIFAASNHEDHFRMVPGKATGGWLRILNPFSNNELIVALPYMVEQATPSKLEEMLHRSKEVGNLPRYIIQDEKYIERIDHRDRFITYVTENYDNLPKLLTWTGIIEKRNTVPGTLFAVHAGGTRLGLMPTPMDFGYDGQCGVDYGKVLISVMVPNFEEQLLLHRWYSILSYKGKYNDADPNALWKKTEIVWWDDLRRGGFSAESWKMGNFDPGKHKTVGFPLARSLTKVQINDLHENVFNASENIVCRMVQGCALIDFAGPGWQVHQVTAGKNTRKLNYSGIKHLLIANGLLVVNENGKVAHASTPTKIRFNWIVPFGKRSSWTNIKPRTIKMGGVPKKEYNKNWVTVKSCCDMYVEQYVIVMEEELQLTNKKDQLTKQQ